MEDDNSNHIYVLSCLFPGCDVVYDHMHCPECDYVATGDTSLALKTCLGGHMTHCQWGDGSALVGGARQEQALVGGGEGAQAMEEEEEAIEFRALPLSVEALGRLVAKSGDDPDSVERGSIGDGSYLENLLETMFGGGGEEGGGRRRRWRRRRRRRAESAPR